MAVCYHCAGWGRYSAPSSHELDGQTCRPCGGTGNTPERSPTILAYQGPLRYRRVRVDWDLMPLCTMQNHDPGDEDRSER